MHTKGKTSGMLATAILVCGGLPTIASADRISPENMEVQAIDAIALPALTPAGGAGILSRTRDRLWVTIATSGLDPDAAYTVWWVIFENPENCAGGPGACADTDLGNAAVAGSAFLATGFVTGADGTATVSAHHEGYNMIPGGTDVLLGNGLSRGNGFHAEVHMVVRSHGAIVPGNVAAQISTIDGACDVNTCADQQAIVFPGVR